MGLKFRQNARHRDLGPGESQLHFCIGPIFRRILGLQVFTLFYLAFAAMDEHNHIFLPKTNKTIHYHFTFNFVHK